MKKFFIKLVLILLLFASSYAAFVKVFPEKQEAQADAEFLQSIDEALKRYSDPRLRTEQAFALFHKRIEKIIDTKIKQTVDRYENLDTAKEFCPADGSNATSFNEYLSSENCSLEDASNFSTACVARLASIEYEGLKQAMSYRADILGEPMECFKLDWNEYDGHILKEPKESLLDKGQLGIISGHLNASQKQQFEFQTQVNAAKSRFIVEELGKHKKALEYTVRAFDEFRWSYPVHRQYEETIELLLDYNRELVDVRLKVEDYKAKFENATTPKCS